MTAAGGNQAAAHLEARVARLEAHLDAMGAMIAHAYDTAEITRPAAMVPEPQTAPLLRVV